MTTPPDYIIWKINESEEQLRSELQHPELFAAKTANLKPGSRRLLEVLAVRRALKELLYGEEREVLYTADGAPFLADGPHISISHTDGYAAVIAADGPVGIDIERIGSRVERVVSRFLRPEEEVVLRLAASECGQPLLPIHLAWSAKEAAFKVLGNDFYDLQHLTTVQHIDWAHHTLLLGVDGRCAPLQIHFDTTDDYVLAWVAAEE